MKVIDCVYAHIYGWYNQMKTNGRKVDPQRYTALAFSICSVGWLMLCIELYDRFLVNRSMDVNMLLVVFVALLSGGVIKQIYSRNERYIVVYNKYTASGKMKNKGKYIFYSWLFIFSPYVLFLLFCPWS
jgi:hypothetical protein